MLAPALAALLLAGVGAGVWRSNRLVGAEQSQQEALAVERNRQVQLRGVVGSEKEAFFADARVQQALAKHGLTVTIEKAGSRDIAVRADPGKYDFGFPGGAPAGALLKERAKARQIHSPFYTPIVLASWKPLAEILVANGVARRSTAGHYDVDLAALLKLVEQGKRWRDLKDSAAFATGKSILPASTDVRSSNSAAMYLALASYLLNGEQVVQSAEEVDRLLPKVAPLFLRQGFQESSSSGPFEDYLALGMGKAPLVVVYESQVVEFWLRHPDRLKGEMVLLYPHPTVYSKHVLVPFTPAGERLGQALENDPALRDLAQDYGFRTGGDRKGPEKWRERGLQVPEALVDVIDPPSHEWLERLIQGIEQRFK
jgi:hypothetical protein